MCEERATSMVILGWNGGFVAWVTKVQITKDHAQYIIVRLRI